MAIILIWIVVAIILALAAIWLAGFLLVTAFTVPACDLGGIQRVLVIFPHADDEAMSCGGALHRFAREGKAATLILLTKGERGTPDATPDAQLKRTRTREAEAVAKTLGIARLIQEDFGDGELSAKQAELAEHLTAAVERERPDLLITYDSAGFYGHPDHIACSRVVTTVRNSTFPHVALWYVTFPARILRGVRLPASVASEAGASLQQAKPTHKLFIGASVFPKIAAWYTYKSQRASLTKGVLRFAPIWFFLSMMLFEYFAEVE